MLLLFYHRSEYLPELTKLQDEMVSLTFNGDHADAERLKLYDVEDHFSQLNKSLGGIADNELARFSSGCKDVTGLIRSEISGHYGEAQLFQYLDALQCEKCILHMLSDKSFVLR